MSGRRGPYVRRVGGEPFLLLGLGDMADAARLAIEVRGSYLQEASLPVLCSG